MADNMANGSTVSMPLAMVPQGKTVRLVSINGGRGMVRRLTEMGLVPGTEMTVFRNSGTGPFLLAVNGTRLALGRGMAYRIRVT